MEVAFLNKKFTFQGIFIIFLFVVNSNANAQDGCRILASSQDRLYTTPYTYGAGSPTTWISTSGGGGGYRLITSKVCFDDLGPTCTVYKFGTTGSSPPAAQVLYVGTYAEIIECPIDDYIWVFLIFIAGVAYLTLSKENHLNEDQYHHRSL